jgi:hypothetical protein
VPVVKGIPLVNVRCRENPLHRHLPSDPADQLCLFDRFIERGIQYNEARLPSAPHKRRRYSEGNTMAIGSEIDRCGFTL